MVKVSGRIASIIRTAYTTVPRATAAHDAATLAISTMRITVLD